jgi:hypothetical protein
LKKPKTSVEGEIRTYFTEDTKPKGTNVLAYWAGFQKKNPDLVQNDSNLLGHSSY